ncbi:MAG: InlB B-repeat-containing protein, partial [Tenericutes bacterium]|nr:InlB B-repeat-containing protein [Mycoplasmatota bacterium]
TNTEWHLISNIFEPYTPTKQGFTFLGWYYDQAYTNAYEPIILDQEITLYAHFEEEYYTVTYFDTDKETILYETEVTYGEAVTPPSAPDKSPTISFTYTFKSWSEDTDNITSDLYVYPQYDKAYIPESITIKPGLDTIIAGNTWVDTGVTELDPFLSVVINEDVNTSIPGKYIVEYAVYDGEMKVMTIKRMVRITEIYPSVTIELNEGLSTIPVGGTYTEAGATYSEGEITIISDVDMTQAGTYIVIYQVTVNNIVFEKTRYVHVVEINPTNMSDIYWYKEERDIYVA